MNEKGGFNRIYWKDLASTTYFSLVLLDYTQLVVISVSRVFARRRFQDVFFLLIVNFLGGQLEKKRIKTLIDWEFQF